MDAGHTLETTTTTLEWKVTGLKKLFDTSKGDVKSKVVRSAKFGGGKWQILFYPNSGTDGGAHLSLYLSCEPTAEERDKASLDGKWVREGKYKFNFELCTIGKSTTFNRKEASDHCFNYKTANWGWAQFARRDAVYYSSSIVRQADSFCIVCEITSSPSPPSRPTEVPVQIVPKSLMLSIGGLLNDPLYSDVEFVFPPRRQGQPHRKIYAMKAMLRRADYFSSLLDSGFAEDSIGYQKIELPVHDDNHRAHALPCSPLCTYDSDFDDQSDEELDDDSSDEEESTTSEVQTEVAQLSIGEEVNVAPSVIEQDQTLNGPEEGESSAKSGIEEADDSEGLVTPVLTPSWHTFSRSNPSLPGNTSQISSDEQHQIHSGEAAVERDPEVVPGPLKVRIPVKDVAYRTYLAMLHYLYTDNIYFAPLASNFSREIEPAAVAPSTPGPTSASSSVFETSATGNRPRSPVPGSQAIATRKDWLRVWHANNSLLAVGPCSAKAMYQLADKLNLLELKAKAFKHIVKSMTVQNIPHEMFSSFSARFEEVRKVQVEYFLSHWETIRSSDSMADIWQQIRGGKHPGFEEVWPRIAMNLVFKPHDTPPVEAQDSDAN